AFAHGHTVVWAFLLLGAAITVFYMFRQVYMTFFGEFRGTHEQEHHLHDAPPSMAAALVVLGALSVVGGLVKLPEFLERLDPFGGPFGNFLAPVFTAPATRRVVAAAAANQGAEAGLALLSLVMVAAGWYLAYVIYRQGSTAFDWVAAMWGG